MIIYFWTNTKKRIEHYVQSIKMPHSTTTTTTTTSKYQQKKSLKFTTFCMLIFEVEHKKWSNQTWKKAIKQTNKQIPRSYASSIFFRFPFVKSNNQTFNQTTT